MTKTELLQVAKPILFNTEMVRAILDNRKSVTRRVIKPKLRDDEYGFVIVTNAHTGEFIRVEKMNEDGGTYFEDGDRWVNPPYQVGDILYVREKWRGNEYIGYEYKADGMPYKQPHNLLHWRPSIHMPKEVARIFLKVTGVWVERLQDITVREVLREGLPPYVHIDNSLNERDTLTSFLGLWNSTIKKQTLIHTVGKRIHTFGFMNLKG